MLYYGAEGRAILERNKIVRPFSGMEMCILSLNSLRRRAQTIEETIILSSMRSDDGGFFGDGCAGGSKSGDLCHNSPTFTGGQTGEQPEGVSVDSGNACCSHRSDIDIHFR